jgi:tripartite-type tricarboxylate transporter receptor subunit TctC
MKSSIFIMLSLILSGILFAGNEVQAAEQYPAKPITLIVPLEAGSDGDILLRPVAQKASEILGKPIMVVNKPGAGSSIGFLEIHGAKPDGYVIGYGAIVMLTSKLAGVSRLGHADFTHLGAFYRMGTNVFGSTKTKRPFRTIEEAISFAKSHPGEISISSASKGQNLWVAVMAFMSRVGIDANVIPQAGAGGLPITQIAGGHADLAITHFPAAKSQLDAGNIRFLAVMGPERIPGYPDVPTLRDLGYDFSWEATGFIIGPPKMPKDVTDKLARAFEMAANDAEYHKFLAERSASAFYLPPKRVMDYLDERNKIVREIMDKAGILKEK